MNCFKKADNLFTLGAHLDKAIQVYSDKPSTIIHNWVNSDFVKPMNKKENTFS